MQCLECKQALERLTNEHLLTCCGLTIQEYAIRHHLPLDLILRPEQINASDLAEAYPRIARAPCPRTRAILGGLQLAGLLMQEGELTIVAGEIKRLDRLLWDLQWLADYGFQFRQEYHYSDDTHRVVAFNRLKALRANMPMGLDPFEGADYLDTLTVLLAHAGELHAGYLFVSVAIRDSAERLRRKLHDDYRIACKALDDVTDGNRRMLRTETVEDTERLLGLLKDRLMEIPGAAEQFYSPVTEATVVKELVFDCAHFITDHPGKCSNLHGGRYAMNVKIKDRIDPATGFVIDYGYLKTIVKQRVVDRLDHQNLNYINASLAWRSSTELLCVFIWEQLVDYLPGLAEIEIHETAHSYCCYTGPTLAEYQQQGQHPLLAHFTCRDLGKSSLRRLIRPQTQAALKVVGQEP